jgi:hypothetical protein
MKRVTDQLDIARRSALFVVSVLSCAGPPSSASTPSVVTVGSVGGTSPKVDEEPFFFADSPLEGFEPSEPWSFRQETWSGKIQHCHELGYPARLRESILHETNEKLRARGLPPKLPETVRDGGLVFAAGDFRTALVTTPEPLVKLVFCTEGLAPASERERFITALRGRSQAKELTFGEPTLAWKRQYRDGREEYGLRWSDVTREQVAAAFRALAYTESTEDRTMVWRRAGEAMGRMPGTSEVWWTALR